MKKSFFRSKRLFFTVIAVMTLCMGSVFAQISGTITDAVTGEPLIGATVQIKGSTVGTIADFDGNYTLDAAQGDILMFSYVGYLSQEVTVGAQSSINMQLKEDVQELEKIVIVGYSAKKKSDLTGAVSSVSAKELTESPSSDMASALQGRAAGVMITKQSGSPGANSTIRIRGVGSVNNSDPLYVVDGVPVESAPNVRPEDIASIEVLKDASATAIYGNRGANGVIVISTKRGSSGKKPKVSFSAYKGITTTPKVMDVLNSDQYTELMDSMYTNAGVSNKYPRQYNDSVRKAFGNNSTDWQDEILQTGKISNYHLAVSGGSETSNYSISGSYYNEEGIIINTYNEQFDFRANSDFKISDRLKIGESINVSREKTRSNGSANFEGAIKASPLMPIYDSVNKGGYAGPLANESTDPLDGSNLNYTGSNDKTNPVAELSLNRNIQITTRILGNVYANYEIIKGLQYEFRVGVDYSNIGTDNYSPEYELGARSNTPSSNMRSNNERYRWNVNNLLRFHREIGKHDISALLGHEASELYGTTFGTTAYDFPEGVDDPVLSLANAEEYPFVSTEDIAINRLLSHFGRVDYIYANKYLFTANIRRDVSSRFAPENNTGIFPSASFGWRFSEEGFMQGVSFINNAKLRLGWGKVGNQNAVGNYDWQAVIDPFKNSRAVFGVDQNTVQGGMILASFVNPDIRWEATESVTIGTDLALLNNKVIINADYYIKKTTDMLIQKPVSIMSGRLNNTRPFENFGDVTNSGIEASLSYRKFEGVFNYSVTANVTKNKNVLNSELDSKIGSGVSFSDYNMPIASYYGKVVEGIFATQEEVDNHAFQTKNTSVGDLKYADLNKDGIINDDDRTFIGSSIPDLSAGLSINMSYRNFDFNTFIQGVYGFMIYNRLAQFVKVPQYIQQGLDENKHIDALNYYRPGNTNTNVPRAYADDPNYHSDYSNHDLWFEKGDFTRLRNIQLGYTLPKDFTNRIKISRARIYVSGQNLFTLTNYSGFDPELSSNDPAQGKIDNGSYPVAKTYLAGLQLDF